MSGTKPFSQNKCKTPINAAGVARVLKVPPSSVRHRLNGRLPMAERPARNKKLPTWRKTNSTQLTSNRRQRWSSYGAARSKSRPGLRHPARPSQTAPNRKRVMQSLERLCIAPLSGDMRSSPNRAPQESETVTAAG